MARKFLRNIKTVKQLVNQISIQKGFKEISETEGENIRGMVAIIVRQDGSWCVYEYGGITDLEFMGIPELIKELSYDEQAVESE